MKDIIFGPINSRRFGKSLGIDLSPHRKQCNFDCLYCELEPAKVTDKYSDIVSIDEVITSLREVLMREKDIDILTITANGEPTLYPHLSKLMDRIDTIKGDIKTLILSNGSTINNFEVQEALKKFDTVKLSLDCITESCLKRLDRAEKSISIEDIKRGMLEFKKSFKNPLIIEILFVKGINNRDSEIEGLNRFLEELNPTRVDIGTIDRPPAYRVEPLTYEELRDISFKFNHSLPIYIASRKKITAEPSNYTKEEILNTIKKRPLTKDDIELLFNQESIDRFENLLKEGQIKTKNSGGYNFFVLNRQKNLKNS